MAMIFSGGTSAFGQGMISPYQIAMGGGITFTEGAAAQFYNPANLMIQTNRRTRQISFGMGGIYYNNDLQINHIDRSLDHVTPFFMPESLTQTSSISDNSLQLMFGDDDRYYQTRKYDMVLFGVSWNRGATARSIALRSRGLSSFEMNRNWFDAISVGLDESKNITRYLNENYHVFHELSVGFSREVTMFNQWQSGLNTLFIGMSPKIVFGGMHSEITFNSHYLPEGVGWQNSKELNIRASGDISGYLSDFMATHQADQAFRNNLHQFSNMKINGYGLGLDVGLTYIIPLGDDISLSPHIYEPLKKSIRIGVAVSDFGMVRFGDKPRKVEYRSAISSYDHLPETNARHSGGPGEIIHYLHSDPDEKTVFDQLVEDNNRAYMVHLPTELHLGAAYQYNRIATLIDMNYQFISSDFEINGWRASIGSEIRILRFLPLKGSLQMNANRDVSFGMGAGLDLGMLHLSAAIRILNPENSKNEWHTNSISALALRIRF